MRSSSCVPVMILALVALLNAPVYSRESTKEPSPPALAVHQLQVIDWVGDRTILQPTVETMFRSALAKPAFDTYVESQTGVGRTHAETMVNPFVGGLIPGSVPHQVALKVEVEQASYSSESDQSAQAAGIWIGGIVGGLLATESSTIARVQLRITARGIGLGDSLVCVSVGTFRANLTRDSRNKSLIIAAHRATWSGLFMMTEAIRKSLHLKLDSSSLSFDQKAYFEHVDRQFDPELSPSASQ